MKKKPNDQPKLFDDSPLPQKIRDDFPITHGEARISDPETSKMAAALVKAGELQLVFLRCLYKNGNRMAEEISNMTGRALASITPRARPLIRKGLIVETDEVRPGASGADRTVYAITDLGREVAIRSLSERAEQAFQPVIETRADRRRKRADRFRRASGLR